MQRNRLYKRLRVRLTEMDYSQADLAKKLERSPMYVSERFTGKHQWTQKEVYTLCGILKIPVTMIHEYFPEDGKGEMVVTVA